MIKCNTHYLTSLLIINYNKYNIFSLNEYYLVIVIMVSMLTSGAKDRGFEPKLGKFKA